MKLSRRACCSSLAWAAFGVHWLVPARPLWAAAPTAREIARRVEQFYGATKSYRATFRQVYRVKAQGVSKRSSGTVAFARPAKLSFRYDKPSGARVVSDGKRVLVYDRESQQMYETKLNASQHGAALSFLSGEGRMLQDFRLRLLDATRMKVTGAHVLEAVPNAPDVTYDKLVLYVDAATAQVRRVLVLDAQGNVNRFEFHKPVINEPIPDSEFRFTPPRGTTTVKP